MSKLLKVPFKVSKREEARSAVSKSYWDGWTKELKKKKYKAAVDKFFKLVKDIAKNKSK